METIIFIIIVIIFVAAQLCCPLPSITKNRLLLYHQANTRYATCLEIYSLILVFFILDEGIPELSIPSFEPLIIPEITMNQGKGSLNLQTTFNDLHLWGLSIFELQDFR